MASKLAIVTEIPRIENTRPIMAEAAELLFVEVGQRALGDSPDNPFARQEYIDEVDNCRLFAALNKKAKVIGAATLDVILPGDGYILMSLAVAPKHRERQIGSKLIELAESTVINNGFNKLTLWPAVRAVGFYEKHGYKFSKEYEYANPMYKKLDPKVSQ